jgi:hypothetical protein
MSYGLYTYPWNLHDPKRDVPDIRALGITDIVLACAYHAGKFIQPHDALRRVYFPQDGAIYFRPRATYGRIQPTVSALTEKRDVLHELCERADIAVKAWMVLNHNTRVGTMHPQLTVRNCFDDRYPYSLCPAQPDVRDYVTTLARDLASHYNVTTLLLETPGFLAYAHGFHHEFAQVALNESLDCMLALCFCEACIDGGSTAGVDMRTLKQRVSSRIDCALSATNRHLSVMETRVDEDSNEDADLVALHDWRALVVTSLVRQIRDAVPKRVRVKVITTTQSSHRKAFVEGIKFAAINEVCDGLELPIYQSSVAGAAEELRFVGQNVSAQRISTILRPGLPDMHEEQQLSETFAMLRKEGIGDIAFYNYGMLARPNLDWIRRQLVRGAS